MLMHRGETYSRMVGYSGELSGEGERLRKRVHARPRSPSRPRRRPGVVITRPEFPPSRVPQIDVAGARHMQYPHQRDGLQENQVGGEREVTLAVRSQRERPLSTVDFHGLNTVPRLVRVGGERHAERGDEHQRSPRSHSEPGCAGRLGANRRADRSGLGVGHHPVDVPSKRDDVATRPGCSAGSPLGWTPRPRGPRRVLRGKAGRILAKLPLLIAATPRTSRAARANSGDPANRRSRVRGTTLPCTRPATSTRATGTAAA